MSGRLHPIIEINMVTDSLIEACSRGFYNTDSVNSRGPTMTYICDYENKTITRQHAAPPGTERVVLCELTMGDIVGIVCDDFKWIFEVKEPTVFYIRFFVEGTLVDIKKGFF